VVAVHIGPPPPGRSPTPARAGVVQNVHSGARAPVTEKPSSSIERRVALPGGFPGPIRGAFRTLTQALDMLRGARHVDGDDEGEEAQGGQYPKSVSITWPSSAADRVVPARGCRGLADALGLGEARLAAVRFPAQLSAVCSSAVLRPLLNGGGCFRRTQLRFAPPTIRRSWRKRTRSALRPTRMRIS
jgi:hypothetical protein